MNNPVQNKPSSPKRQRSSVIVERDGALLLVQTRQGLWLLPGGGCNPGELPIAAAARELHEETGLRATALTFLFTHESETNFHHVFHAVAGGDPQADDDAADLLLFGERPHESPLNLSLATRRIIDRFRKTWHAEPA